MSKNEKKCPLKLTINWLTKNCWKWIILHQNKTMKTFQTIKKITSMYLLMIYGSYSNARIFKSKTGLNLKSKTYFVWFRLKSMLYFVCFQKTSKSPAVTSVLTSALSQFYLRHYDFWDFSIIDYLLLVIIH